MIVKKKMKKHILSTLVSAALFTSSGLSAATVTGKVTDNNGNPIAGAIITMEGSSARIVTDANGQYRIDNAPDAHVHLHVYSENHIHGDIELTNISDGHVENFVLEAAIIDNITVTATALRSSVLESTVPVSVLSGEALKKNQAATLGETLQNMAGVHSTYFGPVASSPIIRGTEGPRVKIVQNGLDSSDASRVGPDHNVAVDAANAHQIEVLRGPATLQYGSGAIGGVVNIVDNRIPAYVPGAFEGEAEVRFDSVSDEEFARVDFTGGSGNVAFHFDAFDRHTENYDIPGFAETDPDEDETPGTLEDSGSDTSSFTGGLSYVGDKGYFGFSYQQLDNLYGVPGHSHAHGDEHEEDEHHDEHEEDDHHDDGHSEADEGVLLDVDMKRYQLAGEWFSPLKGISKINYASGFTDYTHVELEEGAIGTTFSNETAEHRISIEHESINGWHGVFGFHQSSVDYSADGLEAFTPPSNTDTFALFLVEEKKFGDLTLQLGARYESSDVDPIDNFTVDFFAEEEGHHDDDGHDDDGHDDEHHDDEAHGEDEHHDEEGHDDDSHDEHDHDEHSHEDHSHEDHIQTFNLEEQSYSSLSLSAGLNWLYQKDASVALSLSHSERAPSHQELFSAGNHIATRTYDLGAMFTLDDHNELMLNPNNVEEEVSTNLDLTFRKFGSDWGYTVSFFYNQVDDYLYQVDTGLIAEAAHAHDEHDEAHHDEEEGHEEEGHEEEHHADEEDHHEDEHGHEEEGNPVFLFQQQDADFYGVEAEFHSKLNDNFTLQLFGDVVRARLDSGANRNLPRIPPMKLGAELDFEYDNWYGDIGVTWYDNQTRVSEFETPTDSYTLVDMSVNYRKAYEGVDWVFYLRGKNLTDEEARVHTSFLKDLAPLPGRSIALGVRAEF